MTDTVIPDKNDGDILSAANLFKKVYSDITTATWDNSQTAAAEEKAYKIPADTVSTGILIMVSWSYSSGSSDGSSTMQIWTGTSATFSENDSRLSQNMSKAVGNVSSAIIWLEAEETWTGDVYVQLSGHASAAGSSNSVIKTFTILGV